MLSSSPATTKSARSVVPNMHSVDQRACKKQRIARILADSAHRVRPPVPAEGNIEPDALAAAGERLRDIGSHAQEHFKFVLSGAPAVAPRPIDGEFLDAVIMRGDDGVEARSLRSMREHEFDQPPVIRLDFILIYVSRAGIADEGPLHQPYAAPGIDLGAKIG